MFYYCEILTFLPQLIPYLGGKKVKSPNQREYWNHVVVAIEVEFSCLSYGDAREKEF